MKKVWFLLTLVVLFCSVFLSILLTQPLHKRDNGHTIAASAASSTCFFNTATIEEYAWYKLVENSDGYYCYFYGPQNLPVRVEGPLNKLPDIKLLDNRFVYFSMQSGTGKGTQWGYFYDYEKGVFSDVYPCIFDYTDNLVAYADGNVIIVCDIFNVSEKLAKIEDFQYTFSNVAFPFVDATFSETHSSIVITYLHGDDYRQVTEVFNLCG